MSRNPEVSVVMGVRDGEAFLERTIDSILAQADGDLEFLIVDDGSTDRSRVICARAAARDPRVRIVEQASSGLTMALINGCAQARGHYIARQDAGDVSLPGRLAAQKAVLAADPGIVMVSCGTKFYGPGGEDLFEINQPAGDATEGLLRLDARKIRGPSHHGSVMFKREDYERVGGYRKEFYYAQDLDLWTRLVDGGRRHEVLGSELYQAAFGMENISALCRDEQGLMTVLIVEAARRRRSGLSEVDLIEKASKIRGVKGRDNRFRRAKALYFVAMCLRQRGDRRYLGYLRDAVRLNPLFVRGWVRLIAGMPAPGTGVINE